MTKCGVYYELWSRTRPDETDRVWFTNTWLSTIVRGCRRPVMVMVMAMVSQAMAVAVTGEPTAANMQQTSSGGVSTRRAGSWSSQVKTPLPGPVTAFVSHARHLISPSTAWTLTGA